MLSKLTMLLMCIISTLLFSSLFIGLNNSMLHLFHPIQKLTHKLKRKKLCSYLTFLIIIIMITFFDAYFNLNNIILGILIGFFTALNTIVFEEIPTNPQT